MFAHTSGISNEPFTMDGLSPQVQLLMRLQSHALRRRAELKACERDLVTIPDPIHPRLGKETILIVDDHPIVRAILRDLLSDWGYRVHVVGGRDDAPAHFDVAIVDAVSAVEETWTSLRQVRQRARHIIVATALPKGRAHDLLRQVGVDAIIAKPIEPAELARNLRSVLGD